MANPFKPGELITPKESFTSYKKGNIYQVVAKKSNRIFQTVYDLYCLETKTISNYPCLFVDVKFERVANGKT